MPDQAPAKTLSADAAGEMRASAPAPVSPVEISVIFVNWNSADYLRECLAGIYRNTRGLSFEIIVVDNASTKAGVDALAQEFPGIILIKSEKNLGFAGANNLGFRRSAGEYVLFLNPDTELVGATLNQLLEAIQSLPDAGVVGCKMLNSDRSVQITSIQKFPTILNQMLNSEHLHLRWPGCPIWNIAPLFREQSKPLRVDIIPGALMLVRRSAFEKVGMFSEDYFMYAEDIDLNYKLRQAGYARYYIGGATIIHHGGKSSSLQKVNQWSTMMQYRAMTMYYRKTRGPLYVALYRASIGGMALMRILLLGIVYPFGNKPALRNAIQKWKVVFRWATGRHSLALGD
jgi:N-acetylglucosaminyl-diphospho-decaprenol L-rhamnosyltransferase